MNYDRTLVEIGAALKRDGYVNMGPPLGGSSQKVEGLDHAESLAMQGWSVILSFEEQERRNAARQARRFE